MSRDWMRSIPCPRPMSLPNGGRKESGRPDPGGEGEDKGAKPLILFNACKKEMYTAVQGYRQLTRKLKAAFRVDLNKDDLTLETLRRARLVVFGGPREPLTDAECAAVKEYVAGGGNLLFLLGSGGDDRFGSNLNAVLADWGLTFNTDSVVRTVYYKYFHPKEVCITNGILNRELNRAAGKLSTGPAASQAFGAAPPAAQPSGAPSSSSGLTFVLPHGCSLNVQKPGVPILSSGFIAYPLNRPVGAVYEHKGGSGRVMALGSCHMFEDGWLEKEENGKLQEVLVDWLTHSPKVKLNQIDAEDPEVNDYHHLPDTHALAERLRVCIEEREELPRDFTAMFDQTMFKFDTHLIPEAVDLYKKLGVKHEPLSLIHPQFETPLPPLFPSVFPPTLRDPLPPALELFDLDEHFATEKARLAYLTNKCENDDLEYYIREAGEALGVTKQVKRGHAENAKAILEFIFKQVVQFKKLNHELGQEGAASRPQSPVTGPFSPSGDATL